MGKTQKKSAELLFKGITSGNLNQELNQFNELIDDKKILVHEPAQIKLNQKVKTGSNTGSFKGSRSDPLNQYEPMTQFFLIKGVHNDW